MTAQVSSSEIQPNPLVGCRLLSGLAALSGLGGSLRTQCAAVSSLRIVCHVSVDSKRYILKCVSFFLSVCKNISCLSSLHSSEGGY